MRFFNLCSFRVAEELLFLRIVFPAKIPALLGVSFFYFGDGEKSFFQHGSEAMCARGQTVLDSLTAFKSETAYLKFHAFRM